MYQFHPVTELFPLLQGEQFKALVADIRNHGLREPIVLSNDKIIDGRNRYRACSEAQVEPRFTAWEGNGSLVAYVLSLNLHRRHLDESQRAMVGAKAKPMFEEEARGRMISGVNQYSPVANLPEGETGRARDHAAQLVNVSPRLVESASKVARDGVPALAQAVEAGEVSVSAAAIVAELPKEEQEVLIARGEKDILAKAREIRQRKMGVHYSSETDEWNTPPEIIARVVRVLGTIDLDPCGNAAGEQNVPATEHYTGLDDGLAQPWKGRVYMNPPYGRVIGDWVTKLIEEHRGGGVSEAIALVPARTDTEWFRLFRECAICFIDGRLKFSGHENSAPFPSAVVYLGRDIDRFHDGFADLGDIWVRWSH